MSRSIDRHRARRLAILGDDSTVDYQRGYRDGKMTGHPFYGEASSDYTRGYNEGAAATLATPQQYSSGSSALPKLSFAKALARPVAAPLPVPKLPWWVWALGATAVVGGGFLLFRSRK